MKHLDLFSGIGGFALAARWAGIETIGFVEIDDFCQKVLRKHWPNVPIISDIHDVREGTFEHSVDIITGGFPCQPFSVAGKREGRKDDRYLWPAMLEVIKIYKPTWVIGENVAGIIDMELSEVLSSLGNEGYEAQSIVIPACAVNAPHRRDRVWIIAHANGQRLQRRTRPEAVRFPGQLDRGGGYQGAGWEEDWTKIATKFCRVDARIPNRVDRIRALGNAIVPQVAYEIMKGIVHISWSALSGYRRARGVFPWTPDSELPEDIIRRCRHER